MQQLTNVEMQHVGGGLPLFGAVTLMIGETGLYTTLAGAYGAGYAIGSLLYTTSTAPSDSFTTTPTLDALQLGNLGA